MWRTGEYLSKSLVLFCYSIQNIHVHRKFYLGFVRTQAERLKQQIHYFVVFFTIIKPLQFLQWLTPLQCVDLFLEFHWSCKKIRLTKFAWTRKRNGTFPEDKEWMVAGSSFFPATRAMSNFLQNKERKEKPSRDAHIILLVAQNEQTNTARVNGSQTKAKWNKSQGPCAASHSKWWSTESENIHCANTHAIWRCPRTKHVTMSWSCFQSFRLWINPETSILTHWDVVVVFTVVQPNGRPWIFFQKLPYLQHRK